VYFVINKNDYPQNGKGKMSEPRVSLQDPLTRRIIGLVREDRLAPGDRLNESLLAERLKVSRSPVRAALARLQSDGILEYQPNRGMILVELPPEAPTRIEQRGEDLLVAIARFRREGELNDAFTEAEVMRIGPRFGRRSQVWKISVWSVGGQAMDGSSRSRFATRRQELRAFVFAS
jgi:DNA-binding transcriptional regulator YhcF (GntR family)